MIPTKRPNTPEWDKWAVDYPLANAILFEKMNIKEEVAFAENYIKSLSPSTS